MNFIHTVNDKTNNEVDVSDMISEQVDPKVGLEAVQKREHAVAGMAASDDRPTPSHPRDSRQWGGTPLSWAR